MKRFRTGKYTIVATISDKIRNVKGKGQQFRFQINAAIQMGGSRGNFVADPSLRSKSLFKIPAKGIRHISPVAVSSREH
jgi:hypothetical protein